MGKIYIDENFSRFFVHPGLGGDCFMTMRQRGNSGNHRVKSPALPVRDTAEEAEADLAAYAAKRGWKELQICRVCGCTDDRACEGGCWWVAPDLCSACHETIYHEEEQA